MNEGTIGPKKTDHVIMLVVGIVLAVVLGVGAYMLYIHPA